LAKVLNEDVLLANLSRMNIKNPGAMKHLKWTALVLGLSLFAFSCTQTAYVTSGKSYEDDEVYYQPGETFISDLPVAENTQTTEDEYYENSENSDQDEYYQGEQNADVINNYYGNDGWNNWGAGINTSLVSPVGSMWTWSPIWGWRLSYNWGWAGYNGWGYSAWNNPWYYDPWLTGCGGGYWDPYWGSPYYNPWGYGWGYNNYGAGYCGSPYAGNIWDDGYNGGGNGNYYGHHTGVSSGSAVNSNYSGGALYSDKIRKPKKPIHADPVGDDVLAGSNGIVRGGIDKPLVIEKEPSRNSFSSVSRPTDFGSEAVSADKDPRINLPDISNKPYVSTRPASNGSSKGDGDDYYSPRPSNSNRPSSSDSGKNNGTNYESTGRPKPGNSGSNSGGTKVERKSSDHKQSSSSSSGSSNSGSSSRSSKPSVSSSPSPSSGGGSRPSGGGSGGGRSSSSSSSSSGGKRR
jgi:hypothetical protein